MRITSSLTLATLFTSVAATPVAPSINDFVITQRGDTWRCYNFYTGSSSDPPSLDFKLETNDASSKWSLLVAKGSHFKKGYDYTNLDAFLCDDEAITNGLCAKDSFGLLRKDILNTDEGSLIQFITKDSGIVSYKNIDESGAYCAYLHNVVSEAPSFVKIDPKYAHRIAGTKANQRTALVVKALLSFALIAIYVRQWQGKEMELDLMNKLMIVYFIGVECVLAVLFAFKLTFEDSSWKFLALFASFASAILSMIGGTAQVLFISLLAKGYTALPKQEYPLKSSHYRMVGILSALYLFGVVSSFFGGQLFTGAIAIIVYVYQIVQFYKTDKLLASMSLRSSKRRSMTLKLMLFYLPLAWFVLVILVTVFLIANNIDVTKVFENNPDWTPGAELLGLIFAGAISPLILFTILYKYWTPQAIYEDAFGFEPTIGTDAERSDDLVI